MSHVALRIVAITGAVLLVLASGSAGRATKLRIGLVVEEYGLGSYQSISYQGFRRALRDFGVQGKALTAGSKEGPLPVFAYFARQGYDLVIGGGYLQANAIDTAARRFPGTTFVLMDGAWEDLPHRPKNVRGTVYRVEEAAYLAGVLAALVERRRRGSDVISSVGGVKLPTVDPFIAGYRAGARRTSPRIVLLNGYSRDFVDQSKCRKIALNQIARGSGVVFDVAGACGMGALAAAKEKRVWGIGVDEDESYLGPHILTSVLKRLDIATYETIRALKEGRLRTGHTTVFGLRNGGVGVGKISPKVPSAILEELERIRRQIVTGTITNIPTTVP